jgi:hypothetical protein
MGVIVTEQRYPPLVREGNHWIAFRDGSRAVFGQGPTELDAIADLIKQEQSTPDQT